MPMTTAATIVAAFFLACILTAAACWLSPRLGFVDRPDEKRKRHARATPLMGGVAIFATFAIASLCLAAIAPMPPGDGTSGDFAL
ncbi:MAG: hypothetical protein U1E05_15645, partial [Patescibacteria group bacterium]|nr:hypothetical protein [Patescibacteria group bacterium]